MSRSQLHLRHGSFSISVIVLIGVVAASLAAPVAAGESGRGPKPRPTPTPSATATPTPTPTATSSAPPSPTPPPTPAPTAQPTPPPSSPPLDGNPMAIAHTIATYQCWAEYEGGWYIAAWNSSACRYRTFESYKWIVFEYIGQITGSTRQVYYPLPWFCA